MQPDVPAPAGDEDGAETLALKVLDGLSPADQEPAAP